MVLDTQRSQAHPKNNEYKIQKLSVKTTQQWAIRAIAPLVVEQLGTLGIPRDAYKYITLHELTRDIK